MNNRSLILKIFVACLACTAYGQRECVAQQASIVRDDALGIAFARIGPVEKIDNATYRITLQAAGDLASSNAAVQLTSTERMFVELPGSYGGRLYYDESPASRMMEQRVLVDTVMTGQQRYKREYWIVYAGMGMWDAVINCSTQKDGRYYIVSLAQQMRAGKPGEDVNGIPPSVQPTLINC